MKSPEKFDFSKKEDQEQFSKLPEEAKKILVDHSQEEASEENDEFDDKKRQDYLSKSLELRSILEKENLTQERRDGLYLELLKLEIEQEEWRSALYTAKEMGDAGKKEFPRILKGFLSAYDFDSIAAKKLAEEMGEEGQDILLQGYLERNDLSEAYELAKKLGKLEDVLPELIGGYIKKAEECLGKDTIVFNFDHWESDLHWAEELIEQLEKIKKSRNEEMKDKKDFLNKIFKLYIQRINYADWDGAEKLIEKMDEEERKPLINELLDRYIDGFSWGTQVRAEEFAERMNMSDEFRKKIDLAKKPKR